MHTEEDEVISLAVSFLAVQMLRFCISGHLPDASGVDKPWQELHSNFQCALLLLAGVIAGGADVARLLHERSHNVNFTRVASSDSKVSTSPVSSARAGGWFQKISAMTFAFSLLFAAEWWISSNFDLDGSLKAVVSALLVTFAAFIFIFGIDKVADMHFEDTELDQALRLIISALGMLVGFSWERCFDAALGGLSTRGQGDGYEGANAAMSRHHLGLGSVPPAVCNLLMAVGLAVLVLPAWKWYILPSLHNHGHDDSKGSEASAHSARKGSDVAGAEEPIVRLEVDLGDEACLFGRLGPPMAKRRRSNRLPGSMQSRCLRRRGGASLPTAWQVLTTTHLRCFLFEAAVMKPRACNKCSKKTIFFALHRGKPETDSWRKTVWQDWLASSDYL